MGIIFEIIFELIIEGSAEAVGHKKVPMALRILAGVILAAIYGGIVFFLLYIGITEKNWIVVILGVFVGAAFGFYIVKTIRKHLK